MTALVVFASGLLFGLGLIVSGMADPGKVVGFLDLAGAWDPSLAFVMAGAVAVALGPFALARRKARNLEPNWLGGPIRLPASRKIDARLLIGAGVFGVGWGLAGICPGPGLVLLGAGYPDGLVFCLAMIVGMVAFEAVERMRGSQ